MRAVRAAARHQIGVALSTISAAPPACTIGASALMRDVNVRGSLGARRINTAAMSAAASNSDRADSSAVVSPTAVVCR